MNAIVKSIDYWDRKVKKLGIFELKMMQVATMGFTLLIVKIFPRILTLNVWWFIAVLIICGAPGCYAFWFKKNRQSGARAGGDNR